MKRIWIDVKGRDCNGCTKCCDGWLVTSVLGVIVGPGQPCKFSQKNIGCRVHSARPIDPCKIFQCHWKENTNIPEYLKPNKVNAIIMMRVLEDFVYLRVVRAGVKQDPKIFEWAEEASKKGKHVVAYDDLGKIIVYSEDQKFIELAKTKL